MASEQTVLQIMGQALWDPKPTETDLASRQLAVACGYPRGWRVVRGVLEQSDRNTINNDDVVVLVDRIYSSKPGTGCDMWLNHAAAMEAAAKWETDTDQSPFAFSGGHLLKIQPRFQKGDSVQVNYEGEWWDAKILRRKEYPGTFKYQVYYPIDSSKQSGVEECLIRHMPTDVDSGLVAQKMGFGEGWKAYSMSQNRWKIVSPEGESFPSKKTALEAYKVLLDSTVDEGDPPWRTDGHEFLRRRVRWVTQYKVSARRTVDLIQIGTITGWISENDLDKEGQPGFVSEKTGLPAPLFHVKFEEDKNHMYSAHLLLEQDLEEYEVLETMLTDVGEPQQKQSKLEI